MCGIKFSGTSIINKPITVCKDISQLNLQTMKMLMFSSFNFSWNLSSDVLARCSSRPHSHFKDG